MDLELNLLISKQLGIPIIDILDLVQAYWMVDPSLSLAFKRSPRKLTVFSVPGKGILINTRETVVRKKEVWAYIRYSARQRALQEHSKIFTLSKTIYTTIIRKLWMTN